MKKEEIQKKWEQIYGNNVFAATYSDSNQSFENIFLPMAVKIASKTISTDLVSVIPMSSGISHEKLKEIEIEIKQQNRESKIDSILEGKDHIEKTIKDHPDYVDGVIKKHRQT